MGVIPEERVVEDWLAAAGSGSSLVTGAGEPVTVLSPGRRNADHGPDFTDALLATRRGLLVGDIEVHVRSSGWWAHGHVTDPAYNRVVLHVVRAHDAGRDAVLANGRTVPTLVLGGPAAASAPQPVLPDVNDWLPCRAGARSPEEVAAVLDAAGLARFEERAAAFRAALSVASGDHVLYAGLLAGLGYRRNAAPMRRLGGILCYETVMKALSGGGAEGLLIGAAGLLPSQRARRYGGAPGHPRVRRLEAAWERYGGTPALAEDDWRHARVRPGNYPVRRLAAMARLLARYRRGRLAGGILGGVRTAATAGELASLVAVPADGLWRDFLDFGLPAPGTAPALCGAGRAADLVVNVVLPFAAARRRLAGDGAGERAAMEAYRSHPALADNAVLAGARARLGLPRQGTALRQQGMLHLHRRYCVPGKCRACPAGGSR